MHPKVILQTNFPGLKFLKRGKVRDIYEVGEYLLIVSTDRISAFDVIMNQGIPLQRNDTYKNFRVLVQVC
ncbi:MAG: hypothetical protein KatS3mg036_0724 [Ignavibacterium sp.]|nr:MAG: hypothetical protein KatS3mg036_0724 [Ignavibacterium sp.]